MIGTLYSTLEGYIYSVSAVVFLGDGQLLVSVFYDDMVRLWDLVIGTLCSTLKGYTDLVMAVVFSGDGQFLAFVFYD